MPSSGSSAKRGPAASANPSCRWGRGRSFAPRPRRSILIVGQAPGRLVHETGIPWNDPSGNRLRGWLGVDRETFYDESRIAIVPMGFCYPGVDRNGGDKPPRPECAPHWQQRFLALMPRIELTLLIGSYAQAFHLGAGRKKTMHETVPDLARASGPSAASAPSQLAQHRLAEAQSMVRARTAARVAPAGGQTDQRLNKTTH